MRNPELNPIEQVVAKLKHLGPAKEGAGEGTSPAGPLRPLCSLERSQPLSPMDGVQAAAWASTGTWRIR